MRKILPLLLVFLLPVRISAAPPVPVVNRVEAAFQNQTYTYTQPEKMAAILTGLRILKYQGTAKTDPELYIATTCRISVFLSNGRSHQYYLRSGGHLSKDHKPWILVDKKQTEALFKLFKIISPDIA